MEFLIVLFILLIIINFFLATSEIALATFGENKLEELKEKNDKYVIYFEKLNTRQEEVYSSTQLAITFLNVLIAIVGYFLFASLILNYLQQLFSEENFFPLILTVLITAIIITSVILIFIYLVPKAIAHRYSDFIGKKSVSLILLLSGMLKYISGSITFLSNIILLPFKEKISFSQERPSEDEILDIISNGVRSGAIDEEDKKIIENIFEFNDLKANEVMVPRTEMVAINILDSQDINIEKIIKNDQQIIPVYEKSLDNILGTINIKDVIKKIWDDQKFSLRDLIRPIYFVPETKLISEILRDMQKQGERIAIVTDEYGGTEGMITIDDILEEIVGEIKDKSKSEILSYQKSADGKYYVLGSMNVEEFNEIFNYELPASDEYNTIAGFVAEKTGKILSPGEKFEYGNLTFELIKKVKQKMVQFRVSSIDNDFQEQVK